MLDRCHNTQIFTNQYDAVSDFPEYPLNVVSDTNAVFGFLFEAHDYAPYTGTPIQLATSPGYTGDTQYFFTLTQNLPLLTRCGSTCSSLTATRWPTWCSRICG